jgi:hypothetical protein
VAAPPPYSIFSASSELLVTAAVAYVVWRGWRHGDFRRGLLVCVLAFEALANISYMAYRLAVPSQGLQDAPAWIGGVAALHGILSLGMFLFLGFIAAMAWRDAERGENFFAESPGTVLLFSVLWGISIVSGEFLFVRLYLV